MLAEIWRDLLGVRDVGAEDNFYTLGGDSIRAIQVVTRAAERGVEIGVADILAGRTIAAIAEAAKAPTHENSSESEPAPLSLLSPGDRDRAPEDAEDVVPLSQLQAALVYHSVDSPGYTAYVTSLHIAGKLDVSVLRQAVDVATKSQPALRTTFALNGFSEPVQIVHERVDLPITVVDWTRPDAAS
ncbi:MAG: phosphopantetheine-binding protein, partial [Planctomycetota bacterium]